MINKHNSVLLKECLDSLKLKENGVYIDLTLGMGGHSEAILKRIPKGKLISFDKDLFAIEESYKRLIKINNNFHLIHADFKNIKAELAKLEIYQVDGIIADLGISSPQIDNAERGFSYSKNARLDMRMNQEQKLDANFIVNNYSIEQLANIFYKNAEVKFAKQIAKAIVSKRPINTTLELANVVRESLPSKIVSLKNPNKAIFQALRIEVNNELDSLRNMLFDAINLLKKNASLAIITFHSLEDSIVKHFFGSLTKNKLPVKMPVNEIKNFIVKTYYPSREELSINNRSRSAKLRVLTKLT
ncbi:rRNA small subunit methyltransferase H [Mycoplasmopsis meleagridis]|uniref:Ribosomal RNA small subunit methyltransferase H n=1 Tax=Mycoplasmopsis meleagridis ATCC 25294 TaxID=1264554 RepID=A0A0F5H1B6_9BACT|nr:16S rRNA (cytosine(1402)-N(4))-methyltransferase RsmH [Mycoplasmopsis meleagridis]KKB27003.1 rRNA small subunit methyltransferase H [Mycoplasmopsis meleagridis ATCC 25294]OAD18350.1 rRNA small subunit methyltransferase H [Mycoplasmopsis meleagridis]VEU77480.1 S-adenosyl-methyltransferase [Mycoplasmopsis meleagridis]